jgi:hypothetical protein
LNIAGIPLRNPHDTLLHGHTITFSTHDPKVSLPPTGVFNWHYIQCVLKKFATDEYQQVDNVQHNALPFRTRDDADDEDVDFDDERNIADPPYPSYLRELAEARARQYFEAAERNRAIEAWSSSISTG